MLDLDFSNQVQLLCIALAGIFLGFSKAGIPAAGTASIPFLIVFFNPKDFTGITLPLLFVSDALAISYYYKYTPYNIVFHEIPSIILGILTGSLMLYFMPGDIWIFNFIGLILFSLVCLRFLSRNLRVRELLEKPFAGKTLVYVSALSTTVVHAGGPFMAMYFLTKKLEKKEFLGVYATTFLCINAIKTPIYLFLGYVRPATLPFTLLGLVFILIGSLIGKVLVRYVSQKTFDMAIVTLIFIASVRLIFKTA